MYEQLRAYVAAGTRLREMRVLRTRNLVGDVAEWIACKELGLTLALSSQKGYDASDALGRRVQIKGVRLTNRRPGALRNMDQNPFDRLVILAQAREGVWSSSPRGFHPQALTEPYVTLPRHTALIVQP